MTLQEYLAAAGLLDDEGNRLELKEARGGIPKRAWESVSAFANSTGGKILFGVDDARNVLGLDNPDQIQADIASTVHQVITPSIQAEPSIVEIEGKRIVALDVPEAEPYLKPVHITNRGVTTGAFKRRPERPSTAWTKPSFGATEIACGPPVPTHHCSASTI